MVSWALTWPPSSPAQRSTGRAQLRTLSQEERHRLGGFPTKPRKSAVPSGYTRVLKPARSQDRNRLRRPAGCGTMPSGNGGPGEGCSPFQVLPPPRLPPCGGPGGPPAHTSGPWLPFLPRAGHGPGTGPPRGTVRPHLVVSQVRHPCGRFLKPPAPSLSHEGSWHPRSCSQNTPV